MQDLVVGEFDLPWLSLGQLAADQKASLEIFEDRLRRNVERRRGALDRVGFVWPARRPPSPRSRARNDGALAARGPGRMSDAYGRFDDSDARAGRRRSSQRVSSIGFVVALRV